MYGCESWSIKKADCQRIDALNCSVGEDSWESLWLKRDQPSQFLKEINPDYSLEGLMLKLKLQYFGHLMWRADTLEKTLMLGKIEGRRRRGWQRMRWWDDRGWDGWMASLTQWTWVWSSTGSWWWTGRPGVLQSMGSPRVRRDWVAEQQQWLMGLPGGSESEESSHGAGDPGSLPRLEDRLEKEM